MLSLKILIPWCSLALVLGIPANLPGNILPRHDAGQADSVQNIDPGRLAIVGGVTVCGVTAIHLYQQNAWWKGKRGPFHVQEDLQYAKWVDKVGHFDGASGLTYMFSKSLQWANVDQEKSWIYGAIGSSLFQTYIEVEDGFAREWGFDRVDFAADILGAWYPVLQRHVPLLQNFNVKFSYQPKTPGDAGAFPDQKKTVMDDYEGQTFWLSVNIRELAGEPVRNFWPDFLCLSIGMAVRDNLDPSRRHLVWLVAPDLDLTRLIPSNTPFLRTLGEILNFVHLPLPALQFSPKVIWFGLYF